MRRRSRRACARSSRDSPGPARRRSPTSRSSARSSGSARRRSRCSPSSAAAAQRQVLVVPIAFVTDHVETLQEIDQLFAGQARAAGIAHFRRTPGPERPADLPARPRRPRALGPGLLGAHERPDDRRRRGPLGPLGGAGRWREPARRSLVLEALRSRPGGVVRTRAADGFLLELGPEHRPPDARSSGGSSRSSACPARRSSRTPARPATSTSAARCIAVPDVARRARCARGCSRLAASCVSSTEPLRSGRGRAGRERAGLRRAPARRRRSPTASSSPSSAGIFAGDAARLSAAAAFPTPRPLGARARKPLPRSGRGDRARPLRARASAGTPLLSRRPRDTSARPRRARSGRCSASGRRVEALEPRATAAGAFARRASGSRPTASFSPRPRGPAARLVSGFAPEAAAALVGDPAPAARRAPPRLARDRRCARPLDGFGHLVCACSRSPDPRRRLELEPLSRPRPGRAALC